MLLQGVLILEFGEGHIFRRADLDRLKGFITTTRDDIVRKYSNLRTSYARQVVFALTINRTEDYHVDDTGNRRWLPVYVPSQVDLEGLTAARDQLFAEAVAAHKAGEPWHPTATEMEELAKPEQRAREASSDPWEMPIRQYLSTILEGGATNITAVISAALPALPLKEQTRATSNRLARILRSLGWTQANRSKAAKLWTRGPDSVMSVIDTALAPVTRGATEVDHGNGIVTEAHDPDNDNDGLSVDQI